MITSDTIPAIYAAFQDGVSRYSLARSERAKVRALQRVNDARYRAALLASGVRFS